MRPPKIYNVPSSLLKEGWESVTGLPVWVRPGDAGSVLTVKIPPQGLDVRYALGDGTVLMHTGTSFDKSDSSRFEYRIQGLYADGSTKALETRTSNSAGALRHLRAVFVLRRPRQR